MTDDVFAGWVLSKRNKAKAESKQQMATEIDVEAEFVKLLEQAENNPIKPLSEEFFARIEALKVKAGQ
jgi:hypothetical protein